MIPKCPQRTSPPKPKNRLRLVGTPDCSIAPQYDAETIAAAKRLVAERVYQAIEAAIVREVASPELIKAELRVLAAEMRARSKA